MLRNDLFKPWFVGSDNWGFEIISGDYQGVTVQIEKLEIPADDTGIMLDYHVLVRPELLEEEELKGDKFAAVIELIINDILQEALDTYEQDRNDNT